MKYFRNLLKTVYNVPTEEYFFDKFFFENRRHCRCRERQIRGKDGTGDQREIETLQLQSECFSFGVKFNPQRASVICIVFFKNENPL